VLFGVTIDAHLVGLARLCCVGIVTLRALLVATGRAVLLHLVASGAFLGHFATVGLMAAQTSRVLVRRGTLRLMAACTRSLHVSGMVR
jgi:hypothetical protein